TDVFPCEDGHAQERSLLGAVLETVAAQDLWIADRNFCTRAFLGEIDTRGGFFIIRQHQGLPFEILSPLQSYDRTPRQVTLPSNACVWWMNTAPNTSGAVCGSNWIMRPAMEPR